MRKKDVKSKNLLVGDSKPMQELRRQIAAVAPTDLPVLITGEVGTGKALVAQLIHENSPRAAKPFVAVNLAAMPPGLAGTELVGYVKGAFTGAGRDSRGRLESANGGTVFLDEVDDARLEVQVLLLGAIDSKTIRRLGGATEIPVDFRLVAAARSELSQLARGHTIRSDFLHRIASAVLRVPPLRGRVEDIPDLVRHFLTSSLYLKGLHVTVTDSALRALAAYDFPGNVRELQSIIHRAAILSKNGIIAAQDLSLELRALTTAKADSEPLHRTLEESRRQIEALRETTIPASPIWEGRSFPLEEDYCFVLMPFAEVADVQKVYEDHVRPLLEVRCGLRCQRADDIYDISGVMQSVWEGINRARVIVADLTERNPNVFYELGIAHTLGKPVVMLTQSMDFVPFDLRHLRCIVYKYKPKDIERLEKALERTVKTVLSSSEVAALSLRQE